MYGLADKLHMNFLTSGLVISEQIILTLHKDSGHPGPQS